MTLALLPTPARAQSPDDALYTFCVSHWSAEGVGQTFFKIARDHHCNLQKDGGTDSAIFWQQEGEALFPFIPLDANRASLCEIWIESGLAGRNGNQPVCGVNN